MSPKKKVQLSSLCLAAMILIMFGYALLVFYVPVILVSYLTTGAALTPFLRFVVAIGRIINNIELLFVPAMLLAFVGSIIWRVQSSRQLHNSSN
ncbi:MAG: hypothetical protein JXA96_01305 [Sedimentisphaerales bacterium]|nr:hypothetical protein [Sedimentisphaerales bacterium]